jgi:hypothetical protein
MPTYLHVGGLVAAGFDRTGQYLLTVSHSGRGVFAVGSWARVARDEVPAYPVQGHVEGIGPIEGQTVAVLETNYSSGELLLHSPDGSFTLAYESGVVTVSPKLPPVAA